MNDKRFITGLFGSNLIKEHCIEKITIEEELYSRKNRLYKLKCMYGNERGTRPDYFIIKLYRGDRQKNRKEKEHLMLRALGENTRKSGIYVPGIFYSGDNFLITDFVRGGTLLEYLLSRETGNKDIRPDRTNPLAAACKMINDFYSISKEITGYHCVFGDVNLRNFIAGSALYRIDLEDWRKGNLSEDFGKLIAFILTYDPAFSDWKIKLGREMIKFINDSFYIKKGELHIEINREFESMIKRRNLPPDFFNGGKIERLFK
jgi:hypothetical protein